MPNSVQFATVSHAVGANFHWMCVCSVYPKRWEIKLPFILWAPRRTLPMYVTHLFHIYLFVHVALRFIELGPKSFGNA